MDQANWQQVRNNPPSTPTRTTTSTVVTPVSHNYYDQLLDSDSSSPSIPPADEFWEDGSFWETTGDLLNTADLEEEILFSNSPASIESFSLADSEENSSDDRSIYSIHSDDRGKTDYKNIAELMEIKSPGSTTPTTEPTTIQLLQFKRTLVSALAKCSLNASNKGHTYIIETKEEHRA